MSIRILHTRSSHLTTWVYDSLGINFFGKRIPICIIYNLKLVEEIHFHTDSLTVCSCPKIHNHFSEPSEGERI